MRFDFYHILQLLNINLNIFYSTMRAVSIGLKKRKNIIDRCNKAKLLSRKNGLLTSYSCVYYFLDERTNYAKIRIISCLMMISHMIIGPFYANFLSSKS